MQAAFTQTTVLTEGDLENHVLSIGADEYAHDAGDDDAIANKRFKVARQIRDAEFLRIHDGVQSPLLDRLEAVINAVPPASDEDDEFGAHYALRTEIDKLIEEQC